MNILIFGVREMVGQGALREVLFAIDVDHHERFTQLIYEDFTQFSMLVFLFWSVFFRDE